MQVKTLKSDRLDLALAISMRGLVKIFHLMGVMCKLIFLDFTVKHAGR
jgi:hypothetical protein